MSIASTPTSSFDVLSGPTHDALLAEVASATTRTITDPSNGVLVVIVRPESDDHHVIAGGGSGVLRAAVSVAAAAGNDRLWRNAPDGDTEEQPVRALPEVIASAADADGIIASHTGRVVVDGSLEAVAIWFETWNGVAGERDRLSVLAALRSAAEAQRAHESEVAALTPVADTTTNEDAPATERTFDPSDPDLDAITGVRTNDWFEEQLFDVEREEALLVLVDIDGFAQLSEEVGAEASDHVLRVLADRLVANCRKGDVIARVGHDRFAILFAEVDRAQAMQVAKRILADVSDPLPTEIGLEHVTATVALSHQVGLVDLEDMLESAVEALGSGKRSGTGRLVLAA
jgi:diguanylate cyclase (GGDEF)-like protein